MTARLRCWQHRNMKEQWFSYLSNRTQTISMNNLKSDPAPVPYGVPQGSVLGSVLFVLYTTPLSDGIERHSIHHHSFADDTQLRKSAPPHHVSEFVQSMQECIHDVKVWMSSKKLKLNDDKTEAVIVSSQRMSTSLPMPDSPTVGTSNVHVLSICQNSRCDARYAFDPEKPGFKSRQNCKFWTPTHQLHSSLSFCRATQKLVLAFIMSRLDYCNSLLYGCPQCLISRLQKVQRMLRASSWRLSLIHIWRCRRSM